MVKNKKDVTTVSAPVVSGDALNEATTSAVGTSAPSTPTPTVERKRADRSLSISLSAVSPTPHALCVGCCPTASGYLGGGALLVFGVIEPPVALAGGLTYEALRRWQPNPTS